MTTKEIIHKDSRGRKITDCEKYIPSGIYEGRCNEISFPERIKCTYVCDFFQDKIEIMEAMN